MLLFLLAQAAVPQAVPLPARDQGLISVADYPREALRKGWQGAVHVDLKVGANGRVRACAVSRSSGHKILDNATCRILIARARFKPARDSAGRPVEGHYQTHINWRLSN